MDGAHYRAIQIKRHRCYISQFFDVTPSPSSKSKRAHTTYNLRELVGQRRAGGSPIFIRHSLHINSWKCLMSHLTQWGTMTQILLWFKSIPDPYLRSLSLPLHLGCIWLGDLPLDIWMVLTRSVMDHPGYTACRA